MPITLTMCRHGDKKRVGESDSGGLRGWLGLGLGHYNEQLTGLLILKEMKNYKFRVTLYVKSSLILP